MNPFEEKLHALKVAYKADKAIAWEEYRAKSAELKNQLAIVSGIKGVPTLHCVIATIKEQLAIRIYGIELNNAPGYALLEVGINQC